MEIGEVGRWDTSTPAIHDVYLLSQRLESVYLLDVKEILLYISTDSNFVFCLPFFLLIALSLYVYIF